MGGLGRIMEGHNIPALTLPFNIAVSTTFLCMKMAGYGTTTNSTPEDPAGQEAIEWDQVTLTECLLESECSDERVEEVKGAIDYTPGLS